MRNAYAITNVFGVQRYAVRLSVQIWLGNNRYPARGGLVRCAQRWIKNDIDIYSIIL